MECDYKSDSKKIVKLIEKAGQSLRDHQIEGLEFMISCLKEGHGCIVADEMGLGKTCQSIAMLTYMDSHSNNQQFLVVSPLSVFEHWTKEIKRFGCGCLKCVQYRGDKEVREQLRSEIKTTTWNVVLTTYEMFLKDVEFFSKFSWSCLIVDEGHRLKNAESQIFMAVDALHVDWVLLLTGTPVQNNLRELFSLLHVVAPRIFPTCDQEKFLAKYSDPEDKDAMKSLRADLKKFVLRRTKDIIADEIPEKSEVLLYHGISGLQKRLYRAILTKNYDVFEEAAGKENAGRQRLLNTLMQLRKCVNHPYLFNGVEPEPFEEGEHLVAASGKLTILDSLLRFLKRNGHKVLLFSQMTKTLDILQDYLAFRGFTYERLDGSVRGEERFAAVDKFNENSDTFVFLLSTKAGGVGLTLTGADTVIFVDSDFNPQNDIQAAARAHRIGQEKPVKIIRLIAKHTVEEIVLARAAGKLKLTNAVLEEADKDAHQMTAAEITEMLTFGLNQMTNEEESDRGEGSKSEEELIQILGETKKGLWTVQEAPMKEKEKEEDGEAPGDMYIFEGKNYKEEARQADRLALNALVESAKKELEETSITGSSSRRRSKPATFHAGLPERRKMKILTPEEIEERKKKRAEAAARKKEREEEEEMRREQEAKERKKKYWESNNYTSTNLPEGTPEEDDGGIELEDDELESVDPIYVSGDVAHPEPKSPDQSKDAIVVHCVDNSGSWPRGGVFGAISNRSVQPEQQYKLAKKVGDLSLGDAHLVPVDELESRSKAKDFAALVVAQDKRKRDDIKTEALTSGLERVASYALKKGCTVHLPRIGYGLANVNWYGIERVIKKVLCRKGIPTYIYYFPRGKPQSVQKKRRAEESKKPDVSEDNQGTSGDKKKKLISLLDSKRFYLCGMEVESKKALRRLIFAFDGDVVDDVSDSGITHVVIGKGGVRDVTEKEAVEALASVEGVVVVKKEWLDETLKKSSLQDVTEEYVYKF